MILTLDIPKLEDQSADRPPPYSKMHGATTTSIDSIGDVEESQSSSSGSHQVSSDFCCNATSTRPQQNGFAIVLVYRGSTVLVVHTEIALVLSKSGRNFMRGDINLTKWLTLREKANVNGSVGISGVSESDK